MAKFQEYLTEGSGDPLKAVKKAEKWMSKYANSEGGRGSDPKDEELLQQADEIINQLCGIIAGYS